MIMSPALGPLLAVIALILGLLGDALLAPGLWGINLVIWVAAAAAATVALAHGGGHGPAQKTRLWALVPILFFAAAFAWRDSPLLKILDLAALLAALSLPLWRPRLGELRLSSLREASDGLTLAGKHAVSGAARLISDDIQWSELRRAGWSRQVYLVGRGLAFAVPLLMVFGGLFMSADANFEALVAATFAVDAEALIGHGFLAGVLAWGSGGFLRGVMIARTGPGPAMPVEPPSRWTLGVVEATTVMVLLDGLFLAFVLLQLPYLFGGVGLVETVKGLTFADYARRGFFELAWVSVLVLPMLLTMHWVLDKRNPGHERIFRYLAGFQVAMLMVIIASAAQRMMIYQAAYGLTELRIYVLAFEAWMTGVLGWFATTVLRGQRERFVTGAVAWGFVAIAALHVPNLEALIVRTNIARATSAQDLDVWYLTNLSADAVPALVEAVPDLPPEIGSKIGEALAHRRGALPKADWRTWNYARSAEREALMQHHPLQHKASMGTPGLRRQMGG